MGRVRSSDISAAVLACSVTATLDVVSWGVGESEALLIILAELCVAGYLLVRLVLLFRTGPAITDHSSESPAVQIALSLALGMAFTPIAAGLWGFMGKSHLYAPAMSVLAATLVGWRSRGRAWYLAPLPVLGIYWVGMSEYLGSPHVAGWTEVTSVTVLCSLGVLVLKSRMRSVKIPQARDASGLLEP